MSPIMANLILKLAISRPKFIFGVTPVKKCSACGAGLVEIARSVRRLSVLPRLLRYLG